jgi:1-acyl-sn-glycerol-3-phosphate acyltransferase
MPFEKTVPDAVFKRPKRWGQVVLFWLVFAVTTLTNRRLSWLVKARRIGENPVLVEGLENIPEPGVFTLAVNHYKGSRTIDVIAAIYDAINRTRPELRDEYLLVVGHRRRKRTNPTPILTRIIRRMYDLNYRVWQKNALRIALGNDRASIRALREWRGRAKTQPTLVFPEGKSNLEFVKVREGSGRWLESLNVPVLPVAVWWEKGYWQVRFGPPVRWSERPELHDLQLGLNIARLLPLELAPLWQDRLQQWQEANWITQRQKVAVE